MNTDYEVNEANDPKSQPESFSKPRTIPSKWDVSAFQSQITTSQKDNLEQPIEVQEPIETAGTEQAAPDLKPDPFPEPRTIPGNWDTSSLE